MEQAFFEGQGEGYWDPSVHYTIGMQCEDCHTMNSIKHDYEPAKPEDIVKDALCLNCHYSAEELAEMIETTQARVTKALGAIDARIQAAEAAASSGKVAADKLDLVQKAKARVAFIRNDFSDGVHNPHFAAKLINEANSYLDQFDKALGKTTNTAAFDLSDLSVYSQAQTSSLGNRHWDMLERTIFNPEDPDQDGCIKCHSAVAIVDDPNAKVADFLAAGQKYCYEELDDAPAGQSPFLYTTAEVDGKYLKNRIEGITCRVCHVFGEDGNIGLRRTEEQTCGLCHGRNFRWDRGSGKHVELAFMRGQGAPELGIADMPSSKYAMGFACQSCHFMDTSKHDFEAATPEQIAANSQCSPCHSAKEIGNRIAKIQKDVSSALAKLNPRLEKALAYVEKNPKNTKANDLYAQAKAGVTFVENDFSNGVHNPDFATMLLERSAKLLTQFEAEFK